MKRITKKEIILYSIILIIFISLSTFVSLHHEYWADELHAWLLAKDTTITELITTILRTDGHPALWHLIIKLFQACGLDLKHFFILPIIFNSLGVALFLFFSNYKWYLKILLPFTYFIFYQYTIISRGYCLILLLLSLVAIIWPNRRKKCLLFSLILSLLISSESSTMLLSGSIYFLWLCDFFVDWRKNKKFSPKELCCLVYLFCFFLLTTIYLFPSKLNTFNPNTAYTYNISESFMANYNWPYTIKAILNIVIIFSILYMYLSKKKYKELLQFAILILPPILFFFLKYYNIWHLGIIFIMFIFIMWIQNNSQNRIVILLLLTSCLPQIYWSIKSSLYDYKNNYAAHEEIANFIKQYDYKNMKIYGLSFYESGTNAYFDKNIYYNWDSNHRFYYWSKKSRFYNVNNEPENINADMIVITKIISTDSKNKEYQKLINNYNKKNDYNLYKFTASTYTEDFKYENMITYILVKKVQDYS